VLTSLTYSLKRLQGSQIIEVLTAFVEVTAECFPGLQAVFNYSHNAMTNRPCAIFVDPTPLQKLVFNIHQDMEKSFWLIQGTDVLNSEFEHSGGLPNDKDKTTSSDNADPANSPLGETDKGDASALLMHWKTGQ